MYYQGVWGLCAALSCLEIAHYYFKLETLETVSTKSGDPNVYDGMYLNNIRSFLQAINVYEKETEDDGISSTTLEQISFDEVVSQVTFERDPILGTFIDYYDEGSSVGHAVVIIGYYNLVFAKFLIVVDSNFSPFIGPYLLEYNYADNHNNNFIYTDGIGMSG